MADEKKAETKTDTPPKRAAPNHPTIEEHAQTLKLDPSTFAGVKVRERWPAQKRVTQHQFQKAVDGFVNGPTVGVTNG